MTGSGERVIEHTLRIAAAPATVWQFWVDPARIATWWGVATLLEPESGGAYRVEIPTGSVMVGEFVELVPYERIVFLFGWQGVAADEPLSGRSTRVGVRLAAEGTGTLLTLRHSGLPEARLGDHRRGWVDHLAVLARNASTAW